MAIQYTHFCYHLFLSKVRILMITPRYHLALQYKHFCYHLKMSGVGTGWLPVKAPVY